jgi:hypothetical protein
VTANLVRLWTARIPDLILPVRLSLNWVTGSVHTGAPRARGAPVLLGFQGARVEVSDFNPLWQHQFPNNINDLQAAQFAE